VFYCFGLGFRVILGFGAVDRSGDVSFFVLSQFILSAESFAAVVNLADVWFLSGVDADVSAQIEVETESFAADFTLLGAFSSVHEHVAPQL